LKLEPDLDPEPEKIWWTWGQ